MMKDMRRGKLIKRKIVRIVFSVVFTIVISLVLSNMSTATEVSVEHNDNYELWLDQDVGEEHNLREGKNGVISHSYKMIYNIEIGGEHAREITPMSAGMAQLSITGNNNFDAANELLMLVNQERQSHGLVPLVMDWGIQDVAMIRAMESNIYFSHTRPDGSSFQTLMQCGFGGENIAGGTTTAQGTFNAWMFSPGHRANMLNPHWRSIGIGHFRQDGGENLWVQLFSGAASTNTQVRTGTQLVTRDVTVAPRNIQLSYLASTWMYVGDFDRALIRNTGGAVQGITPPQVIVNSSSFIWSSSNPEVATVNQQGEVMGVSAGTTTITATLRSNTNFSVSYDLTVHAPPPVPLWRMFHEDLNQHLWTTCENEYRVLATRGWIQEGIAWHTPQTGRSVHRLFHEGIVRHHYTADQNEIQVLRERGWNDEGPLFYCASPNVGPNEGIRMTRLFHESALKHLHTADANEVVILTTQHGWRNEGESFVGLSSR